MRFGVLGPLAVWTADGRPVQVPEVKVRALLAGLLIQAGRTVSADRLIDDLWGERPPADAPAALRVKVSQLRRALGDRELVAYRAPGYVLRADPESVDAGRFESLLLRARQAGDLETRASLLREALGLWRGGAYAEFADEPFAQAAVARLEEQRLVAMEELAETRLELGEHAPLAAELAELVAAHPLRERLRAVHLKALYRAGRQGEALAGYADLRRRLAGELGLDPGPELAALHQAILEQDPSLEAPAARPRTNLPAPLTGLIGRDEAVAEVRALLRANRLVTLTGPGGVGKTRLALAAASEAEGFEGGVWLVELASLGAGAQVVEVAEVIAGVLGLRDDVPGLRDDAPGCITERLPAVLAARPTLLVLDNCEHLVEQVATLAGRLLRAAPGLRVLATSQESLRIEGEALWSVPPLGREAAVQLFTARAGIEPDGDVAEICARLDGIPLALELAATRMRALTPRQLAERLDDRFRLLASGLRGAPARQQTLRAMIDWSWELLTGAERVVLRRLAVHADGCTLEAAEDVAAEPGLDVLDLLARLVDRSLVVRTAGLAAPGPRPDTAGLTAPGPRPEAAGLTVPGPRPEVAGPRYRLLESVAAYCQERLAEAGELESVRLRHARHYAALAARLEPALRGAGQGAALARLDAEAANFRTALDTAVKARAAAEALTLVNHLAWYWVLRGRLGEARRALSVALSVAPPGDPATAQAEVWRAGFELLAGRLVPLDPGLFAAIEEPLARARARWFTGFALFGYDDLSASQELVETALAEFRRLGDDWGTAAALTLLGRHAAMRGDLAALRDSAEQGQALFARTGDRWGELRAAENLGTLAEITGDYDQATALRLEALAIAEDLGLATSVSEALSRLGRIALLKGDHVRADDYHERARRLAAEQSNRPAEEFAELGLALSARRQGRLDEAERRLRAWLGWVKDVSGDPGAALILAELGFVAELRGDAAQALDLQRQGLAAARKVGDPRASALALEGLAGALALDGRPGEAARLLGRAAALRASVGAPLPPGERGDVDRITATLRTALGEDALTAALSEGAASPLEDTLATALAEAPHRR
ncbi:Signal transduction response regulator / Tetratricopeptide repeat-containing protein [[Actinomadura] parvosata subsp. kistnae]|uniref:AfsR family transcriptional regulator n=1 Tax=[Actinomadura] parvosata subsp. kistnae TaxID=1909395 RepID=A0A1V0AFM6_9ACTN|nr:BTAD domain-containing putative transcriptional regulator [Nonomuraea sp. ATCC 55076]AQZ69041.1 AfsR family transcriptional regulator [Nonomuraea sp. ATCC 55076]SPL92386.1 Signal transduction response regulator / Tetratricopeptide repeat-containing protein [Actinomadura parvosata subsp. kistnae]